MSTQAPVSGDRQPAPAPKPVALPPEEKFWQKYSPHHEFPVSTVLSASIYVLAAVLLFLGAKYLWDRSHRDEPLPISIVDVAGDDRSPGEHGGGGEGIGDLPPGERRTEATAPTPASPDTPPAPKAPELAEATPKQDKLPDPVSQEDVRVVAEDPAVANKLSNLKEGVKNELLKQLAPPKPAGRPGGTAQPGRGKGKGPGGDENGLGPRGVMNTRMKRTMRWQLNFRVISVNDHLNQFAGLGAILAVPERNGTFKLFRDLRSRPPRGKIEDVSKLNRIWFHDTYQEHPQAVSQLGRALGYTQPPEAIIAFFPQDLEERMKKMEEEYRGKPENEIGDQEKIAFDVVPRGGGYDVIVSPSQPR